MAVVSDVSSVTIAMDSSFLRVRNLLFNIIIFVDVTVITYYSWHFQLFYLMGITVTINY